MKNKLPIHYDGTCRKIPLDEARERVKNGEKHVIRIKSPKEGTTTVRDLIRGEITVQNETIDDSILVKSDGWALYHFAAMVDDFLMKITHVIRGSEWIPSIPLHALICRSFGWPEPVWIHLSIFLKPSGKGKMSKREDAGAINEGHSIFVKDFKNLGYTPEGVINWISLMGWSYDDKTEFFTMKDLIEKFNLEKLNPSPAAINFSKLDYFNGLHIRNLSNADLAARLLPFFEKVGISANIETLEKIAPILRDRLPTLDDAIPMAGFFFRDTVEYSIEDLIQKDMGSSDCQNVLEKARDIILGQNSISKEVLESELRNYAEAKGFSAGQVFGTLRVAVTGQRVSPPLFESMEIIGYDKVLERINDAIQICPR